MDEIQSVLVNFNEINSAIANASRFLEVKKIHELVQHQINQVTRFARVTTRYGPTIVIDLNKQVTVFLPNSTARLFQSDERFQEAVELCSQGLLGFRYLGDTYMHEFCPYDPEIIGDWNIIFSPSFYACAVKLSINSFIHSHLHYP